MDETKIITNHVPRLKLYGYELSPKERAEFPDLDFDGYDTLHDFFRYRGQVYDLECFLFNKGEFPEYWHGYKGETYFSGMLVRLCAADPDYVIVGRYSE